MFAGEIYVESCANTSGSEGASGFSLSPFYNQLTKHAHTRNLNYLMMASVFAYFQYSLIMWIHMCN